MGRIYIYVQIKCPLGQFVREREQHDLITLKNYLDMKGLSWGRRHRH